MSNKLMKAVWCAAAVVAMTTGAQAVWVHQTVNHGDPRKFTMGCTFKDALSGGKASIGTWVKNITSCNTPANIFGNLHVNPGYPNGGLMLSIQGSAGAEYFSFVVSGKNEKDQFSRYHLDAADSHALFTDGQWHFLLGTYDLEAQTARFYIDGSLVTEKTSLGLVSIEQGRSFAGAAVGTKTESTTLDFESYGAGYNGRFAECSLWNKALTAAEVADLHTRRALMWENGLIGYWPMADNLKDYATLPATREDGSVPDAIFYYESKVEDPDFFAACPTTGRFVISPATAKAAGYTVPQGCDYSFAAQPATNIQEAVDAATSGQTVYVFTGYYPIKSEIALGTKSTSLKGISPVTFAPDRDGVVVDAQGLCRTLNISRKDASYRNIVDSLTLSNGNACVRMYNSELFWGATANTMELWNCRIVGNNAASGNSGVYLGKQGLVSNCLIVANHAANASVLGWMTDFGDSATRLPCQANVFMDCFVAHNTCGANQPLLANGANVALFRGCTFSNNTYTVDGNTGVNAVVLNGNGYARDCTFVDNALKRGIPNAIVNLSGHKSMVSNCVFRNNRGGYVLRALENQIRARAEDVEIRGNDGATALAGCISARNVLAVGNGTAHAYMFHVGSGTGRVENCTFVGYSNGFLVNMTSAGSELSIVNSIANGNTYDLYMNAPLPTLAITNCCIAVTGYTSSKVPGGIPTAYTLNRWTNAPGFKDAANGDYTLNRSAFARDKGVKLSWMTDASLDLAHNPRLVNRQGVAYAPNALPDLGCYECQQSVRGLICIFR